MMHRFIPITVVLAGVVALGGCSTSTSNKGETTVTQAEAPRGCPLGVQGARVTVEDTDDGVAMTFTSPDKVDEMRSRTLGAAAMYGPRRLGEGHEGQHAQGGHHGLQPMQMPPATAKVDWVPGGARLRLVPADPNDIAALRAHARERANAMSTRCD